MSARDTAIAAVRAKPQPAREVRGPSALGGGWRRLVLLTWTISVTDFKLSYYGSVLGFFWSLVRPLMMFAVLFFVFTEIFKVGDKVHDYGVILLTNIVLFSFFSEATSASVQSIVAKEQLVRKMHFPRLVIPLATVLTAFYNLVLSLIVVFVFIIAVGVTPMWSWLLLPVILLPLLALALGASMLLSSAYVRYRDVMPIWTVATTALLYASAVIWVVELAPEQWRKWVMLNPLAAIFQQARIWLIDPSAQSPWSYIGGFPWVLVPITIVLGAMVVGFTVFHRSAPRVAEEL